MFSRIKAAISFRRAKNVYFFRSGKIKPFIWLSIQILAIVLITIFAFVISPRMQKYFEDYICTRDDGWALAFIAIPVALVAVWISLYISVNSKYSTIFANKRLNEIYVAQPHLDFRLTFGMRFVINIFCFIYYFFQGQSNAVITYSLYISIDILYFIFFNLSKYRLNVESFFIAWLKLCEMNLNYRLPNKKEFFDSLISQYCNDELPANQELTFNSNELYYINYFELQAKFNKLSNEEKTVIVSILKSINTMKINVARFLITYKIFDLLKKIITYSAEKADWAFIGALINTMSAISNSNLIAINKAMKRTNFLYNGNTDVEQLTLAEFKMLHNKKSDIIKEIFACLILHNSANEIVESCIEMSADLEYCSNSITKKNIENSIIFDKETLKEIITDTLKYQKSAK